MANQELVYDITKQPNLQPAQQAIYARVGDGGLKTVTVKLNALKVSPAEPDTALVTERLPEPGVFGSTVMSLVLVKAAVTVSSFTMLPLALSDVVV